MAKKTTKKDKTPRSEACGNTPRSEACARHAYKKKKAPKTEGCV